MGYRQRERVLFPPAARKASRSKEHRKRSAKGGALGSDSSVTWYVPGNGESKTWMSVSKVKRQHTNGVSGGAVLVTDVLGTKGSDGLEHT